MARKKGGREKEEKPKAEIAAHGKVEISSEVVKKFERDLKKGAFTVITPYVLASSYNIRVSVAKKVLRELESKGLVILYSGGRNPIYVSRQHAEKLGIAA